jgi:hypothetical protein
VDGDAQLLQRALQQLEVADVVVLGPAAEGLLEGQGAGVQPLEGLAVGQSGAQVLHPVDGVGTESADPLEGLAFAGLWAVSL